MTTDEIIQALISQRDRLNVAIEALQDTAVGKRRGRPPATATASASAAPAKRRRRFTKAQRAEQAERMRQYWAAKKKGAKGKATKAA